MNERNTPTEAVYYPTFDEFYGLSGMLKPETQTISKPIFVSHKNGQVSVKGVNRTVFLDKEDTLRLESTGQVSRILGPNNFSTAVEKFLARTTVRKDMVEYSNTKVEPSYGEKIEVFRFDDGKGNFICDMLHDKTAAFGYGKIVLVFTEDYRTKNRFYTRIVVRSAAKDDPTAAGYLRKRLDRFVRQPSGIFAKAQEKALSEWIESSPAPVEEPAKVEAKPVVKTGSPTRKPSKRRHTNSAVV